MTQRRGVILHAVLKVGTWVTAGKLSGKRESGLLAESAGGKVSCSLLSFRKKAIIYYLPQKTWKD